MATFTTVLIGRADKLSLMRVGMADGAGLVREFELCFGTVRFVALGARDRGMLLRQREGGGSM